MTCGAKSGRTPQPRAAAFALAIAATTVRPDFALPLFLGGVFVACRAAVAAWRRSDLLDRLVREHDAYGIPEVRARAGREASMSNRRSLSHAIQCRLALPENPRVAMVADELGELAKDLLDPEPELDPACAAACSELLTDEVTSPLINSALPAEDVRSRVLQIRAGFHPRG